MKTVVLGDTHGSSVWKLILSIEDPDRVIFLGDYFDSFDFSAAEQIHNFKQIIEYKETSFTNSGQEDQHKTQVILLLGNHDMYIEPRIDQSVVSGFQPIMSHHITQVLQENKEHLQMAYQMDEFLFTHAGVSEEWLDRILGAHNYSIPEIPFLVNDIWKYKPLSFKFYGTEPYGDDTCQSPIWIRPRSLMKAGKTGWMLKKHFIQVVGHTQQPQIDIKGKATGGRYYFIDTLSTSGEYLIIIDNNIQIGKI